MSALQGFIAELGITVTNLEVWQSVALALVLGFGCLVLGVWLTRSIGLLRTNAPAGETLGVGLAAGLMLLTAWCAAIGSGGRSSFTPVAMAFAIAVGLGVLTRVRPPRGDTTALATTNGSAATAQVGPTATAPGGPTDRRRLVLVLAGGACFVVAAALVYGSTIAPSPRDGVQPVEFSDVAFYAVLGRNLATTGVETNLSASGFSDIAGLPGQGWYHWGELWLAGAVTRLGVSAMAARYFVVLPILLLAAAALSGTVVRRWTGADSTRVFLFGFLACLFLAPVALIPGPFFSSWAAGMLFGITLFGMGAVAVTFALYAVAALRGRVITWPLAMFVGSAAAFILPAHIAIALLMLAGVVAVVAVRVARSLLTSTRDAHVSRGSSRIVAVASIVALATVIWGIVTGHAFGGGTGQPVVTPFNETWVTSVAITALGAGVLLAIAVALPIVWRTNQAEAELYFGTLVLLVVGAFVWGARLGDFTMFYVFFAGIAVIATPVAAIASRRVWVRLSASGHRILALGLVLLCALQLEAGVANAGLRLQFFGGGAIDGTIPEALIDRIRHLPPDAKLAYSCEPLGESSFGVARLLSIDAHTRRPVVPMCFQAETLSTLVGATASAQVQNVYFALAPQRALYPNAEAAPNSVEVTNFLDSYGIHYIYASTRHPNDLVPDAIPIERIGDFQILRIP